MTARVLVGRFGAAHGVRGEIRLISFTGDPEAVAAYGPLEDEAGKRRFKLAALRWPERTLVFDDGVQLATEGFGAPGKAQAAARPS